MTAWRLCAAFRRPGRTAGRVRPRIRPASANALPSKSIRLAADLARAKNGRDDSPTIDAQPRATKGPSEQARNEGDDRRGAGLSHADGSPCRAGGTAGQGIVTGPCRDRAGNVHGHGKGGARKRGGGVRAPGRSENANLMPWASGSGRRK
ncbi:hypothetical protein FQR65_LT20902 [Abscondita terminalis]|nr:hypothetical protein FQR65_LT20902 [Abscondita terminalis]